MPPTFPTSPVCHKSRERGRLSFKSRRPRRGTSRRELILTNLCVVRGRLSVASRRRAPIRLAIEVPVKQIAQMNETVIPVAEAARDFLRILATVESRREATVLLRDGKPVARIVPWNALAATCEELASHWEKMEKLPPDEAKEFANDLEDSRKSLPPIQPRWD
jgi:antitoxin (DNA-binding transcriptional repressor) of toxin-antitoxin stability system